MVKSERFRSTVISLLRLVVFAQPTKNSTCVPHIGTTPASTFTADSCSAVFSFSIQAYGRGEAPLFSIHQLAHWLGFYPGICCGRVQFATYIHDRWPCRFMSSEPTQSRIWAMAADSSNALWYTALRTARPSLSMQEP